MPNLGFYWDISDIYSKEKFSAFKSAEIAKKKNCKKKKEQTTKMFC